MTHSVWQRRRGRPKYIGLSSPHTSARVGVGCCPGDCFFSYRLVNRVSLRLSDFVRTTWRSAAYIFLARKICRVYSVTVADFIFFSFLYLRARFLWSWSCQQLTCSNTTISFLTEQVEDEYLHFFCTRQILHNAVRQRQHYVGFLLESPCRVEEAGEEKQVAIPSPGSPTHSPPHIDTKWV